MFCDLCVTQMVHFRPKSFSCSFSIQTILDKHLLTERGVICIDNALFKGEVYLEASERTESGEALREFNRYVKEDPRTEQVGIIDK